MGKLFDALFGGKHAGYEQQKEKLEQRSKRSEQSMEHGELVVKRMKEENERAAIQLQSTITEFLDKNDKLRFKSKNVKSSQE